MARQTLRGWFTENLDALEASERWRRKGRSWRQVVQLLRADFQYPFKDHTALMDFGVEWDKPEPLPQPTTKTVPTFSKPQSFARTASDLRGLAKGENFFVTSAVNNCPADAEFVEAARNWCGAKDGKLLINKVRYKNPTRRDDEERDGEWWDPALREYMLEDELRPHPLLSICTMKAQATADNPLPPRADALTQDRSAIFGHPQLSLRTVATPHLPVAKLLYSSGACTQPIYSDTTAGKLGGFHHSIGGVLAEVRGDDIFLREVTWSKKAKAFIDIDTWYDADGYRPAPGALALAMGDIHVGLTSDDVMEATFGPQGIYDVTQPEEIILHDLFDGRSLNPHEMNNQLTRAAMFYEGKTNVEAETLRVIEWLDALPTGCRRTVVRSNHDEFYDRWLQAGEKNVEPENRWIYHQLCAVMLAHRRVHGSFPIALEAAIGLLGGTETQVEFLGIEDPHRVMGILCGLHGHIGSNGARGNIKGLSRLGSRGIYAHNHGCAIWQGAYQAGHSTVARHGYNRGPSGWVPAHVLLNALAYRQMIIMRGSRYRG